MLLFRSKEERAAQRQHKLDRLLFSGKPEKIRYALDNGANPNAVHKKFEMSALAHAADNNDDEAVALLLAHKDIRVAFGGKRCAPVWFASKRKESILQALLKAGASPNVSNGDGWTALHLAAYYGMGNNIKLLLAARADPDAVDSQMRTAADVARAEKYPQLARMLEGVQKTKKASEETPLAGWRKTADDEICLSVERPDIGYRLTQIFNFTARTYTQIASNMKTQAESQSMQPFGAFDDKVLIRQAAQALLAGGGTVRADVLAEIEARLDKPRYALTPEGTGG